MKYSEVRRILLFSKLMNFFLLCENLKIKDTEFIVSHGFRSTDVEKVFIMISFHVVK